MPHITIGSSPSDEKAAQLGQAGYYEQAQLECCAFLKQLLREYTSTFGADPACKLEILPHVHDFGTYYEVAAVFDDTVKAEVKAAYWFENNSPAKWDLESRTELGLGEDEE